MKKILNLLKAVLPIIIFSVALTSWASINEPTFEGKCNPPSVTLSGNGVGEIKVDGLRVNDANGNWSVNLPLKAGDHSVVVGGESLSFNIPKCSESGVIGQVPCLGLFGKFWDNCQVELKAKSGPTAEEQALITELQNQIAILKLKIQLIQLQNQLKLLGLR